MTPATKAASGLGIGAVGALIIGTLALRPPSTPVATPVFTATTAAATVSAARVLSIPQAKASAATDTQGPPLPPGCDSDDLARAQRYSLTAGYEYLANDCQEIHAWKAQPAPARIGILDWLAQHGHDSPLATCDVFVTLTRNPAHLPSKGVHHVIESGQNMIWFDFHGVRYEHPIDVMAEDQSIAFHVPCWRDRWDIVSYTTTRACLEINQVTGSRRVVPCQ